MRHRASPKFWAHYAALPETVRDLADKNFVLLKADPKHPSLHFKRIVRLWSARVGIGHRALALDAAPDGVYWFWIGTHTEYSAILKRR